MRTAAEVVIHPALSADITAPARLLVSHPRHTVMTWSWPGTAIAMNCLYFDRVQSVQGNSASAMLQPSRRWRASFGAWRGQVPQLPQRLDVLCGDLACPSGQSLC